jgi:hypothetical protein
MDPIGFECPLRIASTPATKVVATAPIPGIMMPNLPLAGAILSPEPFLSFAILGWSLLMISEADVQNDYVLVLRVELQTWEEGWRVFSCQFSVDGAGKKEKGSHKAKCQRLWGWDRN